MHTDDTNLQVITWTTKQNFFLCGGSLLGGHLLLLSLERVRRGEGSRKKEKRVRIRRRWTGKAMRTDLQPPSIYDHQSRARKRKEKKFRQIIPFWNSHGRNYILIQADYRRKQMERHAVDTLLQALHARSLVAPRLNDKHLLINKTR